MDTALLLIPLYNTLAIPLAFIVVGLALGGLTSVVDRTLASVFGSVVYRGWGTIFLPGVILHELSHALFLVLTGARIKEVVVRADTRHPWTLYRAPGVWPVQDACSSTRTGYVAFRLRGPYILKACQRVFGSIAPTVVGLACAAALVSATIAFCTLWWQYAICVYLILCVLNCSNMSTVDVRDMLPGLPVCLLVLYVVLLVTGFDLLGSFPAVRALLPGLA